MSDLNPIPTFASPEEDFNTILRSIVTEKEWEIPVNQILVGAPRGVFRNYPIEVGVRQVGSPIVNPKWNYTDITFTIMVVGQEVKNEALCSNTAWALYNELIGRDNEQLRGEVNYLQFNSTQMPTNQGVSQEGRVMYTFSITLNRQSLMDEGNRLPLQ
jgi:hypothetical protein